MEGKQLSAILIPSLLAVIIGAVLLIVGIFVTATVGNSASAQVTPVAASGTLTWNGGNSSCGDIINVTNVAGAKASFYVNVTGASCVVAPAGYALINVSLNNNVSTITAQNTTIAMNINATINGTMVATNGTNSTVLTYSTTGTAGNSVITTVTAANASWSSGKLTGGVDGNAVYGTALSNAQTNTSTAFTLLGIILIVGGAGGIILVLTGFMGTGGRRD